MAQCQWGRSTQPKAERPFLTLLPSFVVCEIELSFIHVPHFISATAFTEQPYISSLGFKAPPVLHIKTGLETGPWPEGWEAARTLSTGLDLHFLNTPAYVSVPSLLYLEGFFFQLKMPGKCEGFVYYFLILSFFLVPGGWLLGLQNLQCSVPACGGICGCKAWV